MDPTRQAFLKRLGEPDTGLEGLPPPAPPPPAATALPGAMPGLQAPYEQGGYTGGTAGPNLPEAPPATAPVPQRGRLEGFEDAKFAAGHDSPKYRVGNIMKKYDQAAGITPEMLAEINALGIGTASGSGDKLRFSGNVDPRFNGVTEFDVIRDLENGGAWQWAGLNGGAGAPAAPGGGNPASPLPMAGGADVSPYLRGDAAAKIRQELDAIINGGSSPMARNAILQRLGG